MRKNLDKKSIRIQIFPNPIFNKGDYINLEKASILEIVS